MQQLVYVGFQELLVILIWSKLPFKIVLIATFLPWVAAFFDAKWITYIPISLGLLTYFLFETRKNSKIGKINYGILFILLVIYFSVSWQLILGIGIGSGGTIITITLTIIYLRYFTSTQYGIPSKDLIQQIHIIYVIHIIFILFSVIGFTIYIKEKKDFEDIKTSILEK